MEVKPRIMRSAQRQLRGTGPDALIKTSIQLRPETVAKLDALSVRDNLSRAAVIARLIDRGLEVERAVAA